MQKVKGYLLFQYLNYDKLNIRKNMFECMQVVMKQCIGQQSVWFVCVDSNNRNPGDRRTGVRGIMAQIKELK